MRELTAPGQGPAEQALGRPRASPGAPSITASSLTAPAPAACTQPPTSVLSILPSPSTRFQMQTYFQEGLDNQLNGQIVCLDGFVSVILLQKLTHRLGTPAYSISLKEECILRCRARQSRTSPRTRPQLPGPAVSEAAWPLGPALWTPFPKSYLELVLILSHEWDSPLLLKDTRVTVLRATYPHCSLSLDTVSNSTVQ